MKPQPYLIALALCATLSLPAQAQDWGQQQRAQQQIIRQQQMDIQHRHHQPGHPGYVGPRGQSGSFTPPAFQYPERKVIGYKLISDHMAVVLAHMPHKGEIKHSFGRGTTPAEAEQEALRECRDIDSRARCHIAARLTNACVGVISSTRYLTGGHIPFGRVYITPVDFQQQGQDIRFNGSGYRMSSEGETALKRQAEEICRADTERTQGFHCENWASVYCATDRYEPKYADD